MHIDQIVGFDYLKRVMRTRFKKMLRPNYLTSGMKVPHGIVLSGPPGCGKTEFMSAVVETYCSDSNVFKVDVVDKSNIAKGQINETAKLVNKYFDEIRKDQSKIHILYIDEADDLFVTRKHNKSYASELTGALLRNMEGFNSPNNYYILAATNYEGNIDPAILDRLELNYTVLPPSQIERKQLIELLITSKFDICDISEDWLIKWSGKMTQGFTGRDFTKVQIRLDDILFELQEIDENARISTLSVSMELTKQSGYITKSMNPRKHFKDKLEEYYETQLD
ncbi:MAG TPA: ATP-binding protein [Desulfobacterales bacterium]|nr:ATP-binding protein [Desulfobacterales bacterium]